MYQSRICTNDCDPPGFQHVRHPEGSVTQNLPPQSMQSVSNLSQNLENCAHKRKSAFDIRGLRFMEEINMKIANVLDKITIDDL
jgi:hypothetical protein